MDVIEIVDDTITTDTERDVVSVPLPAVVTTLEVAVLVAVPVLVELIG